MAAPRAGLIAMTATPRVVCVGAAFWDTILRFETLPDRPGKVLPLEAVQVGAGMAPAAAVTVARLGGRADLWSRVGDDPIGGSFRWDMEREGVDVSAVRRIAGGRTPIATILVDGRGERLVLPFVDPTLDRDASWLPLDRLAEAAAVLADVRWIEGAAATLTEARRLGVPTIVDADVAPRATLEALLPLGDHLLFSEAALMSLTAHATPERALLDMAKCYDPVVAGVTLGGRGAVLWQRGGGDTLLNMPGIPIRAVDTLSAGDTWHGAYLYGLSRGWSLDRTARYANVAAAMKCETFGGRTGTPNLDAVESWIATLQR